MKITKQLPDGATITGAEGVIGWEAFTLNEMADMADVLDREIPNVRPVLVPAFERMRDLLWALQNDTSAMIIAVTGDLTLQ